MKKYSVVFLTIILLSMICACGQEDVDNIQISNADDGYLYAYFDYDNGGKQKNIKGFEESTPFYEFALPDGSVRLVLYYDEATGLGGGLRYYQGDPSISMTSGVYGFSFMGVEDAEDSWMNRLNVDYTKFESCWGDTVSSWPSCEENIEYDDAGRVAHYEANGTIDGEPACLLSMYYEYDDNGILRQRQYYHHPLAFSSTSQSWYSYFDELGRLEYESRYITHGSLEYYYIYSDESAEPAYGLLLDNNCGSWIPKLVQF